MTTHDHENDAHADEPETISRVGPVPGGGDAGAGDPGFAPGEKIGAYTVVEQISAGGFGRVLRAHRVEPVSHDVAIKTLRPDRHGETFRSFFDAERRVLASLEHPNIARFIDAGETEDGAPYLVMEYVRGEPMTAFVRMNRLTLQARAGLVAQACRGAHHAHEMGLVHRDIKPDNLLVSYVGGEPSVKIVDFGLAHLLGPSSVFEHDSGGHMSAGTPGYLSPEQDGRTRLDVDRRADVWSLAATMHTLAVGRAPTPVRDAGDGRVLDYEPVSAALASAADLDRLAGERRCTADEFEAGVRSLESILSPALDPDRQRRPSTALELGRALEAWAAGRPGETGPAGARAASSAGAKQAQGRRRGWLVPVLVGAGVVGVVVVLCGVAVLVWVMANAAQRVPQEPLPAVVRQDEIAVAPPEVSADLATSLPAPEEAADPDRAETLGEESTGADSSPDPASPVRADELLASAREALPLDLAEVRAVGERVVVSGPVVNTAEVERAGRLLAGLGASAVNELRTDASGVRRELARRIDAAGIAGVEVSVRNRNETFGPTYIFVRLGVDAPDNAGARVAELARGLVLDPTFIRTTD